jgi:hypothetical protein
LTPRIALFHEKPPREFVLKTFQMWGFLAYHSGNKKLNQLPYMGAEGRAIFTCKHAKRASFGIRVFSSQNVSSGVHYGDITPKIEIFLKQSQKAYHKTCTLSIAIIGVDSVIAWGGHFANFSRKTINLDA